MGSSSRRLVGFSTKMYFSAKQTRDYMTQILDLLTRSPHQQDLANVDIFILPDHVSLVSAISQIKGRASPQILIGAQDAFYEDVGPYTGAVSPAVLAEVGCNILEVGHAERRRVFGETDDVIARKTAAAVRNGMVPLLCFGELERCDGDDTSSAVAECGSQIEKAIADVPADAAIILAYEPVWAIGASEAADPSYVVDVVQQIRTLDCVRTRKASARIIYGGSAGPGIVDKLSEGVDGLFLGRFAHDPEAFYKTILEVAATRPA